ncbi:hypothetical protein [Halorussus halophilus]|uniref:hypothetical protein n=1 Tax=Halorussus halophilus TaxID=2650975 RepID=UPI0013014983|nr:hypothetical protein [Halorussus halophilus]
MTLQLPTEIRDRYDNLATDLDGFEDGEALARYVLEETAKQLERGDGGSGGTSTDRAEDDVVEDRLEQLGYLEK